jgi:hypothetical protein
MPDSKDSKPVWLGVPKEEIEWHPTVEYELCIGAGCAFWVAPLAFMLLISTRTDQ